MTLSRITNAIGRYIRPRKHTPHPQHFLYTLHRSQRATAQKTEYYTLYGDTNHHIQKFGGNTSIVHIHRILRKRHQGQTYSIQFRLDRKEYPRAHVFRIYMHENNPHYITFTQTPNNIDHHYHLRTQGLPNLNIQHYNLSDISANITEYLRTHCPDIIGDSIAQYDAIGVLGVHSIYYDTGNIELYIILQSPYNLLHGYSNNIQISIKTFQDNLTLINTSYTIPRPQSDSPNDLQDIFPTFLPHVKTLINNIIPLLNNHLSYMSQHQRVHIFRNLQTCTNTHYNPLQDILLHCIRQYLRHYAPISTQWTPPKKSQQAGIGHCV